jgi:hypothetical protein
MFDSNVPFARLRNLLLDLGFEERFLPKGDGVSVPTITFLNRKSGCFFMFRKYRRRDKVGNADVLGTRSHLDWWGLMSPEEFDARLRTRSPRRPHRSGGRS